MSTKNKKISYIFKSVYPTSYTEPNLIRTENSAFRTSLQEDKLNGMPIPKTKNQKPKTILKTPLAFTLVELIVVIVILAILATIAFLSFSSQSASARDSTRLSDMNNIVKGLSVFYATAGSYPKPDSYITLTASGTAIGFQGKAGNSVLGIIKMNADGGKDPLEKSYYTYATNSNQNKFQILGFLEDGSNTALSFMPISFAADYSKRFTITRGDDVGILLSTGTLDPVENKLTTSFTGVDLINTVTPYSMKFSKAQLITGTGIILKSSVAGAGLIGYWPFDEGNGTTVKDISGNGNDGSLSGTIVPAWTGGKVGGALDFNYNSVITKSTFGDNVSSMTINAWIYPRSTGYAATIVSKDNGPGDLIDYRSWYFSLGGTGTGSIYGFKAALWTGDAHNRLDIGSAAEIVLNKWNNVSIIYNGNTMKLCLNGVCSESMKNTGNISTTNNIPVRIGMINYNYYFDGVIDEVRIYDRALSDFEISNLYNSTK